MADKKLDEKLDDALDDTFPASDPPSMTQPKTQAGAPGGRETPEDAARRRAAAEAMVDADPTVVKRFENEDK